MEDHNVILERERKEAETDKEEITDSDEEPQTYKEKVFRLLEKQIGVALKYFTKEELDEYYKSFMEDAQARIELEHKEGDE
jgi:hypothetical protein